MTTLRRLARTTGGAGFPHAEQGLESGELPFVKVSDFNHFGNERVITTCNNWVSRETARRLRATVVPTGSVLLPKVGAALLGNARRIVSQPSVFDNNVLGVIPTNISSGYLHYWLTTVDAAQFAKPGPVPSMDDSAVLNLRVPIISRRHQRAIADYLDTETARIDALITKKRRMIELLDERSRSAVAERLDSLEGGDVHLSHVARIYSGSGFPLSYQGKDVGDYPFFKVSDLASSQDGRWIDSAPNWVDRATSRRLGCRLAPVGSVLFPKVGAALLGNQRRITRVMAAFDNNLMAVTSTVLEPRYLRYVLALVDLGGLANPGPVPSVNEGVVGSLPVKVPSSDVQVSIADALDTILDAHSRLASRIELEIRLLEERRQALITAAVTGELSLPGVAA